MEGDFGYISHRSSASQTPPAMPNETPPFRWDNDRQDGYFANGDAASFPNPNYSMEALQYALSELALAENALRPCYDPEAGVAGGVVKASQLQQLEDTYARVARFMDRDMPRFVDAQGSALPRNLAEHGMSPYVFANYGGGVDLYGSSSPFPRGYVGSNPALFAGGEGSSSPSSVACSPSNLIPRGLVGSNHAFHSGEMANGSLGRNYPCAMVDCSYQYNSSHFQVYPQQQHQQHQMDRRQKFLANNVPNGARTHPHAHTENRRNSRPKLEIVQGFISLMDLRGSVMSWATDQNGCRILQAKIQEAKEEEVQMILAEVIDHSSELMTHPCGNYFTQKLIDVCTDEGRSSLLFSVIEDSRQLISICCDIHGTRCIQKLLENLKDPRLITQFILALRPGILKMIKDSSGFHVIQYCLNTFSAQQTKYMLKEVVANCFDIARDINGCRVINQCVGNCVGEDKDRLLSELIECALPLSEDLYGNYVVQHILEMGKSQLLSKILRKLSGNFVSLSRNKYGSHVVEKCLRFANFYQSSYIIRELLWSPFLLSDPYGNFVMQRALSVAQGDLLRDLFDLIEEGFPSLRTNMYGRKVIGAYEKKRAAVGVNMYYH